MREFHGLKSMSAYSLVVQHIIYIQKILGSSFYFSNFKRKSEKEDLENILVRKMHPDLLLFFEGCFVQIRKNKIDKKGIQ